MFDNIYNGKKVLVTGNTGFKGSWLSLWLKELGAEVYGLANGIPTTPSMFKELELSSFVHHHDADIRDLATVKKIVGQIRPDYIFHLAAQALVSESYTNPLDTITTNVVGTANILEAVRGFTTPCRLIIITSDKCYDNVEWVWGYKETDAVGGKDIYSGSKGAAECIFKSYFNSFYKNKRGNITLVSARAGNVIGGGDWAKDRLIPDCIKAWTQNNHVEIRSPESTRPWQHVLEPLSGYLALGWMLAQDCNLSGESFNFGPAAQINKTVLQLLNDLSVFFQNNTDKAYLITDKVTFDEAKLLKLNCDKALHFLKWRPTLDYPKLIEFTGSWYADFYNKQTNMRDFTLEQIREYENLAKNKELEWTK